MGVRINKVYGFRGEHGYWKQIVQFIWLADNGQYHHPHFKYKKRQSIGSMFVPMHDLRPLGGQKQGGAGLKSTILGFIIQYIFSFYTTICTPRNDSLFWRFRMKQRPCSSKSRLLSRHSKIRPCKSLIEMFLRTKFIGVWHQLFNLCAHDAPPERNAHLPLLS